METENLIRKTIESLPYSENYKELRYLLHQALAVCKRESKRKNLPKTNERVEYERHEQSS
jgi:hypothetical protein